MKSDSVIGGNGKQSAPPIPPKHPKDVTGEVIEIDESGKVSAAPFPPGQEEGT